jgi:ribosomal protein S18 acetylase RimI-like enzyme
VVLHSPWHAAISLHSPGRSNRRVTTRALIRVARPDDLAELLALWLDAPGGLVARPDSEEALRVLLAHTKDALLVAELDGETVGAVIAAWDGWRGNIYRLAVRAEHRRHGLGRLLIEAGETRLRAKGARRVTALVAKDDPAAVGIWEAAGYLYDEPTARYVRNL